MILLIARLMQISLLVSYPLGFIPFLRDKTKYKFSIYTLIIGILILIVTSIDSFLVFPKMAALYKDYKVEINSNLYVFFIIQYLLSIFMILIGVKLKKFILKNNQNLYLIHTLVTFALIIWFELLIQTTVVPIKILVEFTK